jgi:ribosome-binding protein aMBF1 (putative translation factor)
MSDVVAMIDVSCPKCRRRFGWYGRFVDRPPCPRCDHQIKPADLERAQDQMNHARDLFRELREKNSNWNKWQEARVAAGLTLRQAARILDVKPSDLSDIEQGRKAPDEALMARMAHCYDGGE